MQTRPEWDEYFMSIVEAVSLRATCNRGKCACVVVRDQRIISTGYVGTPPGVDHCDEVGHLVRKMISDDGRARSHCVRTIHAEQNAIAQAARYGQTLGSSTFYCTMEPCRACAMLVIAVGAERVVAAYRYQAGEDTRELLKQAGIALVVLNDEVMEYDSMEQV
ncbi:deoxycytidylate deaminase [Streptomyces sp. NBC_01451]|uniref:deoxycytidylate deaminase n=1 Tax=Streptomyces sp. NBC_01451 TaxID=2903872 RepID=UPI002E2F1D10|nr:cytidine/deoxycytidylate deaminase family protein [Streptomyces sp. NBC_01451]